MLCIKIIPFPSLLSLGTFSHIFCFRQKRFVQKGARCKIPYLVMKELPYKLLTQKLNSVHIYLLPCITSLSELQLVSLHSTQNIKTPISQNGEQCTWQLDISVILFALKSAISDTFVQLCSDLIQCSFSHYSTMQSGNMFEQNW